MPSTVVLGIWIADWFFKRWSDYWSDNQMVIWIPNYHGTEHLKSEPLDKQTNPHDLNTKLVCKFRSQMYSNGFWNLYVPYLNLHSKQDKLTRFMLKTFVLQAQILCLSDNVGQTKLNSKVMSKEECLTLRHKDVFTIGDRLFRYSEIQIQ